MAFSRRSTPARRREARHRWEALFPAPTAAEDPLLDLTRHTDADPLEGEAGAASGPDGEAGGEPCAGPRNRGPRLGLSLRLGAVVAALLAVSCLAWGVASGAAQPDVRSVADLPAAEGTASGSAETPRAETAPSASGPTVHVAGGVVAPGVYHLAEGARVYEAIAAAGGAEPGADVDRLNLAASIEDGTRLRVPLRGEPEGAETEAGTASGAPAVPGSIAGLPGQASRGPGAAVGAGGRVNINTATAQELGTLPRVGPVLAQRIVDYRTAHGRFAAPEDLDAVSGIGPKMLESLLPLVAVR